MADPVSLAVISLIGTAAGAGANAYGGYEKGAASQNLFNYRARVAQINAGIAGEQSAADLVTGDIRAQTLGLRTGERMGLTRAGMAAGGLDLGGGSARRVLGSEAEVGEFEQASIRNDAARRAYASRVGAFSDTAQSQMDIAAGRGARQAGGFDVASSFLGGATQVADKWAKFDETGAFKLPEFIGA